MSTTEETANDLLKELIDRTLEGVDSIVVFGQQEIPILIEQLLMWHGIESFLFFLIFFILAGCVLYLMVSETLENKLCGPVLSDSDRDKKIKALKEEKERLKECYNNKEHWTLHTPTSGNGITSIDYDKKMSKISNEISNIYNKTDNSDRQLVKYPKYILGSVVFLSILYLILNNLEWLKILVAPKLYLFEYGTKLVGG